LLQCFAALLMLRSYHGHFKAFILCAGCERWWEGVSGGLRTGLPSRCYEEACKHGAWGQITGKLWSMINDQPIFIISHGETMDSRSSWALFVV
jgi:hypothetical protein